MAEQLDLPLASIRGYGERPQTVTDHAREAMAALGMRPSNQGDLELMIEAAAQAAWAGDRGTTIVQAVVDALKGAGIVLPTIGRIERAAIAGRARGRKRAYAALTARIAPAQFEQLDALLAVDGKTGRTPLAWLRDMTSAPKAAIVWWNSTYMADAVTHLRASGEPAPNDLLAHTSPVGWEHIAFSGDFLWDRAAAIPAGRRELTLRRRVRGAA